MNLSEFLVNYVPALKLALESNDGWKGPEYFVDESFVVEIEMMIESKSSELAFWLDFIDYYFDSKSHNLNYVTDEISMDFGKQILRESIASFEANKLLSDIMSRFETCVLLVSPKARFG